MTQLISLLGMYSEEKHNSKRHMNHMYSSTICSQDRKAA